MDTSGLEVRQGTAGDLELLVPLFDAYRQFYRQPSDPERARRFLSEHFEHRSSVIFLAFQSGVAIGFTQLYPSFSSLSMARTFILNDLFVSPERNRRGAAHRRRKLRPPVWSRAPHAFHRTYQHHRPISVREGGLEARHRLLRLPTDPLIRAESHHPSPTPVRERFRAGFTSTRRVPLQIRPDWPLRISRSWNSVAGKCGNRGQPRHLAASRPITSAVSALCRLFFFPPP